MSTVNFDILRNAISTQMEVVLAVHADGALQEFPSKFVPTTDDQIAIEYIPAQRQLLLDSVEAARTLRISFKLDYRTITFTTQIIKIDESFAHGEQTLAVMFVNQPINIEASQRRQSYRAKVHKEYGLKARIWLIPRFAYLSDVPSAKEEMLAEISDLSINGMGVRLTMRDGSLPRVTPDDRLRIHMKHADWDFVLEGRIRAPHKTEGHSIWTGIVFKKLENDIKGRKTLSHLTQMVGELQRLEVKTLRKSQEETETILEELAHAGAGHSDDSEFHI